MGKKGACSGAVEDVDGGSLQDLANVRDSHRYVLRKILVENPNFSVWRGIRHSVAVVVEKNPVALGIFSHGSAHLWKILVGRVENLAIPSLVVPPLVLVLQRFANSFQRFALVAEGSRIDPAFLHSSRFGRNSFRRIDSDVQAEHKSDGDCPHAVSQPPRRFDGIVVVFVSYAVGVRRKERRSAAGSSKCRAFVLQPSKQILLGQSFLRPHHRARAIWRERLPALTTIVEGKELLVELDSIENEPSPSFFLFLTTRY